MRRVRPHEKRSRCGSSGTTENPGNLFPLEITYPGTGNYSQFSYDAFGRCVKIVEVSGGTTTSTKQFAWCGDERCEVRDASGALLNQYFARGQVNFSGGVGTSYFYTLDHLGSVREMANSSGSVVYQQSFDPYGQPIALVNTTAADFGYAGYYVHARSGLNLTRTRSFNPALGRFTSRDPIGTRGGINLYSYVASNPINFRDPMGLSPLSGYVSNTGYQSETPSTDYGNGSANYSGATQWNGDQASQSGQGSGWQGSDWQQPPPPPHRGGCSGGDNGDDGGPPPPPEVIPPPPPLISIFPPVVFRKTRAQCYKEFTDCKDDCAKTYEPGTWEYYECIGNCKAAYFRCLSGAK